MNNKERYKTFWRNTREHFMFYFKGEYFSILAGAIAILLLLVLLPVLAEVFTVPGVISFMLTTVLAVITSIAPQFLEKKDASQKEEERFERKTIVDAHFPKEVHSQNKVRFSSHPAVAYDARNIKKRTSYIKDICEEVKKGKKNVIICGESGSGKSVLVIQTVNQLIEDKKFFTVMDSNNELDDIRNSYTEFNYFYLRSKSSDKPGYLVVDQIDRLAPEDIQAVLDALGTDNKLLCAVKNSELHKVLTAFENLDKNLDNVYLQHIIVSEKEKEDNLFKPEDDRNDRAWDIMDSLSKKLEIGECRLVQYQFVNLLYKNGHSILFENQSIESDDFFKKCEVGLFEKILKDTDSEEYVACLGLLRLLSDNRAHLISEVQHILMYDDKNKLTSFVKTLVEINFLRETSPNRYQTTHEWIGSDVFVSVSMQLLSGDTVNYLDLVNKSKGKYDVPLKHGYANSEENIIRCNKVAIIAVLSNLLLSWLTLRANNQLNQKSDLIVVYLAALDFALFAGMTYILNFYKGCCSVCSKKGNTVLYIFGLLLVIIPQLGLLGQNTEFLYRYGAIACGLINASIGVVYLLNSKNKEASAKAWLIKKGKLFMWIGSIVAAIGVIVGSQFKTNEVAAIVYVIFGVFCWLAAENYIHFQSLPWQRIMLCLNEPSEKSDKEAVQL